LCSAAAPWSSRTLLQADLCGRLSSACLPALPITWSIHPVPCSDRSWRFVTGCLPRHDHNRVQNEAQIKPCIENRGGRLLTAKLRFASLNRAGTVAQTSGSECSRKPLEQQGGPDSRHLHHRHGPERFQVWNYVGSSRCQALATGLPLNLRIGIFASSFTDLTADVIVSQPNQRTSVRNKNRIPTGLNKRSAPSASDQNVFTARPNVVSVVNIFWRSCRPRFASPDQRVAVSPEVGAVCVMSRPTDVANLRVRFDVKTGGTGDLMKHRHTKGAATARATYSYRHTPAPRKTGSRRPRRAPALSSARLPSPGRTAGRDAPRMSIFRPTPPKREVRPVATIRCPSGSVRYSAGRLSRHGVACS
jgi:hypothetical protein